MNQESCTKTGITKHICIPIDTYCCLFNQEENKAVKNKEK